MPTFVRAGTILPHGPLMQWTGQAPLAPLRLDLYPAPDETSFVLYEDGGDGFDYETSSCFARTTYRLQQTAPGARLTIEPRDGACLPPARSLELRVRRWVHVGQAAPCYCTIDTPYPHP